MSCVFHSFHALQRGFARIFYILYCYFVSNSRSIFGFMIPYGPENLVIDVYLIQSQPLSDRTSLTERQMYWRWSVGLLISSRYGSSTPLLLTFSSSHHTLFVLKTSPPLQPTEPFSLGEHQSSQYRPVALHASPPSGPPPQTS